MLSYILEWYWYIISSSTQRHTHTHAHAYAHVHEQHYKTAEEARNAEASFNLGLMHYYGNDVAKPFILKQRKHKITISKCSCSGRVAEESSKSMEIIVADVLQQTNRFDPRPQTTALKDARLRSTLDDSTTSAILSMWIWRDRIEPFQSFSLSPGS